MEKSLLEVKMGKLLFGIQNEMNLSQFLMLILQQLQNSNGLRKADIFSQLQKTRQLRFGKFQKYGLEKHYHLKNKRSCIKLKRKKKI